MQYIQMFFLCFLLLNNISLIAQHKIFENYDVHGCRYKIDTLYNDILLGSAFFDCKGKAINVYQKDVDDFPKKLYSDEEWNTLLKNEISKITRMDINIFIVYGIIIDNTGSIVNIQKLSTIDYDDKIEDKIVFLLKKMNWKPAKLNNVGVYFYLSFPIKINLM